MVHVRHFILTVKRNTEQC